MNNKAVYFFFSSDNITDKMSQLSWMSSQVEIFTPRVIFHELWDRDPKILPSSDD